MPLPLERGRGRGVRPCRPIREFAGGAVTELQTATHHRPGDDFVFLVHPLVQQFLPLKGFSENQIGETSSFRNISTLLFACVLNTFILFRNRFLGCSIRPGRLLGGFADSLSQLAAELGRQITQRCGYHFRFSVWRSPLMSQSREATFHWQVLSRSSDLPLGNERAGPTSIHYKLLDVDSHSNHHLVASDIVQVNTVRAQ